jgi:hypothetical protein
MCTEGASASRRGARRMQRRDLPVIVEGRPLPLLEQVFLVIGIGRSGEWPRFHGMRVNQSAMSRLQRARATGSAAAARLRSAWR